MKSILKLARRAEPDVHRIEPPHGLARGFRMLGLNGADLTVWHLRQGGWTGFEAPLPSFVGRWMATHPGLFIDVGANTGFYSLLALQADRRNRVLAFEPDDRARALLARNAALNRCGRRLRIDARALSDRTGEAAFYIPLQDHGLVETSSSLEPGFKAAHSEVRRVPAATLDAVLPLRQSPGFIKIDVEGHEAGVLRGSESVLQRHRPLLAVELLPGSDWTFFNELKTRLAYRSASLRAHQLVEHARVEHDSSAWNRLFAPEERWPEVLAAAATMGL